MFSKLEEIISIRNQKKYLSNREAELLAPPLNDLNLINIIYKWFNEIIDEGDKEIDSVSKRKRFIFIILILYSPRTLIGDKMKNGLRNKLSNILEVNEKSVISNNVNNLLFSYQHYKDFRNDVNSIFFNIINRLNKRGIRINYSFII